MNDLYKITVLSAASLLVLSCSMDEKSHPPPQKADGPMVEQLRHSLPDAICVYDPQELYPSATKSASEPPVTISSENLDYDNATMLTTGTYDYIQVPVEAVTPLSEVTLRFPEFVDARVPSETTGAKMFLVAQFPKDTGTTARINIVTIIPHPDYMTDGALDSLDFFYNGHFNAVFIYADLDGTVLKSEAYAYGALYREGIISAPEDGYTVIATISPSDMSDVPHGGSDSSAGISRSVDWLDQVVIVGRRPKDKDDDKDDPKNEDPDHPSNQRPETGEKDRDVDHNLYGGGGGGAMTTMEVCINVSGRGSVSGGGTYYIYDDVVCTASPEIINGTPTSEFISWSGYVESTDPTIRFILMPDSLANNKVYLSAFFHNLDPCSDKESGRGDPLLDMKIQGSGDGGWNIRGGTFGDSVRTNKDGTPKAHNGMDFACPVGTPVHATHSGVVVDVRSDVRPGISWEDYCRENGSGKHCDDIGELNAGNAVEIESTVNGQTLVFMYYHLTQVLVNKGSVVAVGEIIGTSGITGNGGSDLSGGSHLHYQVEYGGRPINPKDYLYSRFDSSWNLINPCR